MIMCTQAYSHENGVSCGCGRDCFGETARKRDELGFLRIQLGRDLEAGEGLPMLNGEPDTQGRPTALPIEARIIQLKEELDPKFFVPRSS